MTRAAVMYTRCPKCQTVFHVTPEQLQARAGLVRCGQCSNVFQADRDLHTEMPEAAPTPAPKKARANSKAGSAKATPTPERPARRAKHAPSAPAVIDVTAAPAPWHAPSDQDQVSAAEVGAGSSATRTEKRPAKRRHKEAPGFVSAALLDLQPTPRAQSTLWIAGSVLLVFALAAQAAYFYRDALAEHPQLRPLVAELCQQLGCNLRPSTDVGRIELVQPTNIAPHPRIANALRLRATMVNRAPRSQPLPLLEVSLTDSTGNTLARRSFAPPEYLEQRSAVGGEMLPNLAVGVLLDITNPDGKAVGYQIDFVSAPIP